MMNHMQRRRDPERRSKRRRVCVDLVAVGAAVCVLVVAVACKGGTADDPEETVTDRRAQARAALRARATSPPPDEKPPAEFVEYRDKEVGFAVWAPRKPTAKVTPLRTPAGNATAHELDFGVEGATYSLLITVTKLPVAKGAPLDAEGALLNLRDGIRRKISGKMLSDAKWKPRVEGEKELVARELRLEGKLGRTQVVAYCRLVVRGDWLYQVLSLHAKGAADRARLGDAFVRSFKPIPMTAKRDASGASQLPVTLGIPTIEVKQKFNEQAFFLKIAVNTTVVTPLQPLEQVYFATWCKVGNVQKLAEHGSQGLRAVAAKQSKELHVAPFLDKPLADKPSTCQLDVSIRKAATEVVKLGSFCFAQQRVTTGACPK